MYRQRRQALLLDREKLFMCVFSLVVCSFLYSSSFFRDNAELFARGMRLVREVDALLDLKTSTTSGNGSLNDSLTPQVQGVVEEPVSLVTHGTNI